MALPESRQGSKRGNLTPCLVWLLLAARALAAPADDLPGRAVEALRRSSDYLTLQVGDQGRYPRAYDPATGAKYDGDARLTATAFVVGPDATAAVGLSLLDAFEVTGETAYRDAAMAAARVLADAQLASGGWPRIADPATPGLYTRALARRSVPRGGRANTSDLVRGVTADSLRLLLALGEQTGDVDLLAAAQYGVRSLLNAQLANGAWPAAWPLPDDDRRFATLVGTPETLALLLTVDDPAARAAAVRAADFLLLTGLDPVGWAAAYDPDLRPLGDLDPAATAAAAEALLALHEATPEPRYLGPIFPLLPWLRDRPELADLAAEAARRVAEPELPRPEPSRHERARRTAARAPGVLALVSELDDQGRWLDGDRIDVAATLTRMRRLLDYLHDYEPVPQYPGPGDGRPPQHRRM